MNLKPSQAVSYFDLLKKSWGGNHGNLLVGMACCVMLLAWSVGYFQLIPEITITDSSNQPRVGPKPTSAVLNIEITGFVSKNGLCSIALHDLNGTATPALPIRNVALEITDENVLWSVSNLPFGKYAVIAFQDTNKDGILSLAPGDAGEPRGISGSRDAKSPADDRSDPAKNLLEAASFEFSQNGQRVLIELH
ncbi:MAG: DUF2141 domain-containing protein [Pirellulales bacterium]